MRAGKAAKPHTSVNAAVSSLEQQPWEAVGTLDVKQPAGAVRVKEHDCLPVGCQEGGLRPTEPPGQLHLPVCEQQRCRSSLLAHSDALPGHNIATLRYFPAEAPGNE